MRTVSSLKICFSLMRAVSSLKICSVMCCFCQYHIKFSAKKTTEELSLMTLKSDPNFEEKLTSCLKVNMRNLVNFNRSSGKSENLYFDGLLLSRL